VKKYRLYIADLDERFVKTIRDVIHLRQDLELVGNSGNGRIALTEIIRLSPDVVLTDIPLPEMDGIALLREVKRLKRSPAVIVCTRFYSQASMNCAGKYGAAFFLCKPVDVQALANLLVECAGCADPVIPQPHDTGEDDLRSNRAAIARNLLKRLGIPPKLNGSAYLLEAVLHCREEYLMKNLSRGLYAEIARRMNTTPARVERSLRSAIRIGCERGTLSRHFPGNPSNRQLIAFVMSAVDQAERDANENISPVFPD